MSPPEAAAAPIGPDHTRCRVQRPAAVAALPLAAISAAYLVGLALLLPHCRHQINPDGIGYIRLATYWASRHFRDAINGYWSPLLPLLLAPFARAGADMLWASKVVTGLGGLGLTCAAWFLYGRFGLSPVIRAMATAATAAAALDMATQVITPDLLAAALLTLYFGFTIADPAGRSPGRLVAWGALAGLAYLAKSYALPFVALHLTVTAIVAARRSREPGQARLVVRSVLWFGVGASLLAAPWIAALSWKYGHPTISTASAISHALSTAGRDAEQPLGGFRIPTGEALTYWEDPSLAGLPYQYWSPFASLAMARRQASVIGQNLVSLRDTIAHLQRDGLFAAALLAALGVALAGGALRQRQVWALAAAACYVSGYALTCGSEDRYYWPLYPVLIALLFQWLDVLRAYTTPARLRESFVLRSTVWWVLAGTLVCSCAPVGTLLGRRQPDSPDPLASLAAQTLPEGLRGPVGASSWHPGLFLCYFANLKFAGIPTSSEPGQIVREAQRAGVRTFVAFPGANRDATSVGAVSLDGIPGAELIGEHNLSPDAGAQPVKLYRIHPPVGVEASPSASPDAERAPLPTPGLR